MNNRTITYCPKVQTLDVPFDSTHYFIDNDDVLWFVKFIGNRPYLTSSNNRPDDQLVVYHPIVTVSLDRIHPIPSDGNIVNNKPN